MQFTSSCGWCRRRPERNNCCQNMKWFLVIATALVALAGRLQAAQPSGRLNIVLFLVDDLGWRDLACQGSTFYQTPNIDQLAREGARFMFHVFKVNSSHARLFPSLRLGHWYWKEIQVEKHHQRRRKQVHKTDR